LRIAYFDCCFVGSSLRIGHIYCSGEQRSGDHFLSAFARNWREIWACWRRNLTHSGCLSHSHLNGRLMLLPGTLYSKWVRECVWVCDLMEFVMISLQTQSETKWQKEAPSSCGRWRRLAANEDSEERKHISTMPCKEINLTLLRAHVIHLKHSLIVFLLFNFDRK
jgi:hypothetical protein